STSSRPDIDTSSRPKRLLLCCYVQRIQPLKAALIAKLSAVVGLAYLGFRQVGVGQQEQFSREINRVGCGRFRRRKAELVKPQDRGGAAEDGVSGKQSDDVLAFAQQLWSFDDFGCDVGNVDNRRRSLFVKDAH